MNGKNQHIIQRQSIEINFNGVTSAAGLQNRMAELFYEKLQPRMATLFDEMADGEHTAAIERMEIDCGVLSVKHWEEEWVEAVLRRLKEQLRAVNKKKWTPDKITTDFFFFLKHGRLPWNSTVSVIKDFEEVMVFDANFFSLFKKKFRQEVFVKRLLSQFSQLFIAQLIQGLQKETALKGINRHSAEYQQPLNRKQQEIILKAYVKENGQPTVTGDTNTGIPSSNKEEDDTARHDSNGKTETKDGDELSSDDIFINNAGLVILHPFLPILFEELGLTNEKKWVSEAAQHRAVIITGFLVMGEDGLPEFDLLLNKLLCGVGTNDVLLQIQPIDPFTQAACEELLVEVIKQWSSLKNTGIAGLREAFLQRSGKLSVVDNGWLLQVEQKGMDVLLNKLPWGIGVIKLPWMEEILHTEW